MNDSMVSNADLRKMLEQAMTRFQNLRVQIETNPNPRMVHNLKNMVSIIDSIASMSAARTQYSYKTLSQQMATMINEVASLNLTITNALQEDDYIDETEEKAIMNGLVQVVQSATTLIRYVQEGFGSSRTGKLVDYNPKILSEESK